MRKVLHILVILILTFCYPLSACAKSTIQTYLQNLQAQQKQRVVVFFKGQVQPDLIARYNGHVIRQLKTLNALVCEIDKSAFQLIKSLPDVEEITPDMVITLPRPPVIQKQPGLIKPIPDPSDVRLFSYTGEVKIRWNNLEAGLNSKAAWDRYDVSGEGVKIAFLDNGVNYTLPDLEDNYLGGVDYVDDDNDPITRNPDEYHGTEVISLAVAKGVSKVVGVAFDADYYVVRVLDEDKKGFLSDVISGIEWARERADIISMSFGTFGESPRWEDFWKPMLKDAVNTAYDAGVILVAPAGNEGFSYSGYPAAFDNVISVGMHAINQVIPTDSNGGVDVVAPGYGVVIIDTLNDLYLDIGTSFATPHVAGLIALQLEYAKKNNIEYNTGYHWEVMKHGAVDLGVRELYQGKGKAYAAGDDFNDPNTGSIDLMALNWPIASVFEFGGYAFTDGNCPVYHIASEMQQSITLTNITDIFGNSVESIENLTITVTQVPYDDSNEPNLPGDSIEIFPIETVLQPGDANSLTFYVDYSIPPDIRSGLKQTKLGFEFNFVGSSRILKLAYEAANSLWHAGIAGDSMLTYRTDFTGGLPAGWSIIDGNSDDWSWTSTNPGDRSDTNWTGEFMIVDSDTAGEVDMYEQLVSEKFDCSAYENVILKFKHYFRKFGSEICDVDVRVGEGSWQNVARYEGADASGLVELDIFSIAAGRSDAQIRWHYYDANNEWYWGIDDVEIWASYAP